jgi:hypothetical protein
VYACDYIVQGVRDIVQAIEGSHRIFLLCADLLEEPKFNGVMSMSHHSQLEDVSSTEQDVS